MNERTLAKALRRRQLRKGMAPKASIHALPDSEILDAYLRCCRCHLDIFSDRSAAVSNASNVEEFLGLVEMALAAHRCPAHN
jgi:hypothetical protein